MPLPHAGFCAAERASRAKILPPFVHRRHRRFARRVRRGIGEHGRDRYGGVSCAHRVLQPAALRRQVGRAHRGLAGCRRGQNDQVGRAGRNSARPRRSRRRLRRQSSDAGPHRRALARDDGVLAGKRLADGGCRLHHACRGRRSEKDADARLHQRPRHGRADLQPEARDRQWPRAGPPDLAVGRDDLANRRPRRLSLSL